MKRFAVIINQDLLITPGLVANAAAIAVGGLRCNGFTDPVQDRNNIFHASVLWNMAVLKAKRQQDFVKVNNAAVEFGLQVSSFCKEGLAFSNSHSSYASMIQGAEKLTILSMAIFGDDESVRRAVKFLSVL